MNNDYIDKCFQDIKFLKGKYGDSQDFKNILNILPSILELQLKKGKYYGRSYCRHGDFSIFLNLERKWDRLYNIMDNAMKKGNSNFLKEGTSDETAMDTIIDLTSYSLLWVGYIQENYPEVFNQFMSSNFLGYSK